MNNTDKPNQDVEKEFVSRMVEKISQKADADYSPQMPSFDLGQQILSQQRKIAALKRKSPISNTVSADIKKLVPIKIMPLSMPEAPPSPQQKIIADIIAREIQALTTTR